MYLCNTSKFFTQKLPDVIQMWVYFFFLINQSIVQPMNQMTDTGG